jgi:hypothetical protein
VPAEDGVARGEREAEGEPLGAPLADTLTEPVGAGVCVKSRELAPDGETVTDAEAVAVGGGEPLAVFVDETESEALAVSDGEPESVCEADELAEPAADAVMAAVSVALIVAGGGTVGVSVEAKEGDALALRAAEADSDGDADAEPLAVELPPDGVALPLGEREAERVVLLLADARADAEPVSDADAEPDALAAAVSEAAAVPDAVSEGEGVVDVETLDVALVEVLRDGAPEAVALPDAVAAPDAVA